MKANELIDKNHCYISSKTSAFDVFDEVSEELVKDKLVTTDFAYQVKRREKEFPTGLDLSPVFPDLKGIAVPHTESEYVKTKKVIPIKLQTPFKVKNMIKPDENVEINFMFMILNNDPSGQANILSKIMGGITGKDEETLEKINTIKNKEDVYNTAISILGE